MRTRSFLAFPRLAAALLICCTWVSLPEAAGALGSLPPPADPNQSTVAVDPAFGAVADGQEEVTITVTVRDAAGQPLANQIVRVASSDPADMVAQPVAPTGANGKATATLATESAGTKVLTATVDPDGASIELNQQPSVQFFAPVVHPNVLIILMDDVGTDSLSMFDEVNPYQSDLPYVHGSIGQGDAPGNGDGTSNLYVNSPSLQQLADEGVTFLNAYAMPVCSPARAALLTGNYPVRTGMGFICRWDYLGGTLNEFGDPGFEYPTLAALATGAAYDDIIIGKWHLGLPTLAMDPTHGNNIYRNWATIPERGGFSQWMCVFTNVDTPVEPAPEGTYYNYYFNRNHVNHADVVADGPETEFATSVQFDEALTWCNSRTAPFVCIVTPNAAHSPWDLFPPQNLLWTEEYVEGPHNAWSGQMAAIEALDSKIGDLVNGLLPAVRAKTTIIVTSDNGIPKVCLAQARQAGTIGGITGSDKNLGETYDFLLDFSTDRFKSSVYEKGTRVPMIVAGYGVTNPGRVTNALVDITDVYPTVADLLDVPFTGEVHGLSFQPILQDSVDYDTHARNFTYTEAFTPLGSTGPGTVFDTRRIGCSLRIAGQGRFKIVYDQDLATDQFYRIQDATGAFVDPFETVNLPHAPGDAQRANYLLVLAKMQEIMSSGADNGPLVCNTDTSFCSSLPNSTGQPAVIAVEGPCSIALNDFQLSAQPVPNQFGIFFYSLGQVNGGNGTPYGNGLRCVGGQGSSVYRLPITMAQNNLLEYTLDFDNTPAGGQINIGSTWNFQGWYRDPDAGGALFNLSDGMRTTFGP